MTPMDDMGVLPATASSPLRAGLRHVTIFFSDLVDFSKWTQRLGDIEASRLANRLLLMQEIIITRDGVGQVLQTGGDAIFAIFDAPSAALNCALEIQRVLGASDDPSCVKPKVRIGLHTGEVLIKEGERVEIISRHVNRAHRVMEVALPGQILASETVVEAAKDFIEVPPAFLAIRYYGEYHLKGVGATQLCEVVDQRLRQPAAPAIPAGRNFESLLAGRLELSGYHALQRLGEGAHGVVYSATRPDRDSEVAIKVLHPSLCEDQAAAARFAREVEILQRVTTTGIVSILEARLDHQPPFFVMEKVAGRAIDVALADAAPQKIADTFRLICLTLESSHAVDVIHCDLKPANILVTQDGLPTLLDFGLSALAPRSTVSPGSSTRSFGTPAYLAPEMITGDASGPWTDVYSLGVILFKVLTGVEPFRGESVHQIVQGHLHEDPPLPGQLRGNIADGLQRICLKALEKKPADRYATAAEMRADLERFRRGELVRTRPTFYDNLLFHRVEKQLEEIVEWSRRGLLSREESFRLTAAYEGLQRRGISALMEARLYRFWQTVVYLGGWALVNGSLLWLVQQWDTLGRAGKLMLGSVPVVTAFGLGVAMWRIERFRLAFVSLVVGVLAVPVLAGVWLHEFKIGAHVPPDQIRYEVFADDGPNGYLTNRQLALAALVTVVAAAAIMRFTATATHSAQTLIALASFYAALQLVFGLKHHFDQPEIEWATVGAKFIPLLVIVGVAAKLLLDRPSRHQQGAPWVFAAAALLGTILFLLARFSLDEWLQVDSQFAEPASWLLLSVAGITLCATGLAARNYLRHRCRLATLGMIVSGVVFILAGLTMAAWDDTWPATWWSPTIFGTVVPAPHLALPLASLAVTLSACRYQLFAFLGLGLTGFAISVYMLGDLYFKESSAWPKLILFTGACAFLGALYLELRRTRGNAIDDIVQRTRL